MSEVLSAALLGGLIGTFFGGFTKFLWEKWLPEWLTWKRTQRVERERQLAHVRAPTILALSDLYGRLHTVITTQAADFHYVRARNQGDYYIDSTAYLMARAFAWHEVLRRRMADYDYVELYVRLESLTTAFSQGGPGFQVYRLEQTEIGERLIVALDEDVVRCMSFSDFRDILDSDEVPRWLSNLRERAIALLEDPAAERDRVARIERALIELLVFLDPQGRWRPQISAEPMEIATVERRDGKR